MFDDLLADDVEALRKLEDKLARLARLEEFLAKQRSTGVSEDGTVRATVDGNGKVLDLDISAEALLHPHPQRLGRQILSGVSNARVTAGEATRRHWKSFFVDPSTPL